MNDNGETSLAQVPVGDLKRLSENERRYRALFEASRDAIFIETTEGRIRDCNTRALELYGYTYDEMINLTVKDIVPPSVAAQLPLLIERHRQSSGLLIEAEGLHKDGHCFPIEISTRVVMGESEPMLVVYVRDLSERHAALRQKKEFEGRLHHQHKMDAIGSLTSGVAHEINNPVNIIMNYAQLIEDDPTLSARSKGFAREILKETERVTLIVKSLLAFSRPDTQQHSPARLIDIYTATQALIMALIRKDQILLQVDIPEDLPRIKCRSQQIQQVLMNLLTNARDAVNARYPRYDDNKIIRISARLFQFEGREYVRTEVEDHGNGIPEAIAHRIFDPFFSTKSREFGTGLGLPICHGIVLEHKGRLTFESQEGVGTHFYLDLLLDNGWSLEQPFKD